MTVAFRGRCVSEWGFAFGRALMERIIFSSVILAAEVVLRILRSTRLASLYSSMKNKCYGKLF